MPNIVESLNPQAVAESFASWFCTWVDSQPAEKARINVALSGGSTPQYLFKLWATEYQDSLDWHRIHFFWGDERCVDPADEESNYGTCKRLFLDHVEISTSNIHRIRGEANPEQEAVRYEEEVRKFVPKNEAGWPKFDLIILGMGSDGHTASIFPNQMKLLESDAVCEVATHPETGQQRITFTGHVLNATACVAFLIVGQAKQKVLRAIIEKRCEFDSYPAAHIDPVGELLFFVDQAAIDIS